MPVSPTISRELRGTRVIAQTRYGPRLGVVVYTTEGNPPQAEVEFEIPQGYGKLSGDKVREPFYAGDLRTLGGGRVEVAR